ncbi:MAG: ABC transporter substrate-binding protein [Anaerolineae bacterium]
MKQRLLLSLALIGFAMSALAGCRQPDDQLDGISLPMGYVANVQFSPFYVAKYKGYFRDAGFDVTFDYRWETDGIQLVAAGELPFTVASGDQVIQARSNGLPVIAVAGWYQTFPVGVIALADTPLARPEHLKGLMIGIPETFGASYIGLRALLKAGGLSEEDIDLEAIGYTQLAALTNGTVDAVVVYANNEPVVLAQEGTPFNAIYAADYVNLVSAVIVSSDTQVTERPEEVEAFVRAFLKGLNDVLLDPAEAFEISEQFAEGLSDNQAVQWPVLTASIDLWEAPQLGLMRADAWAEAQRVMLDAGLIQETVPVERLFTNAFVPQTD